MDHPPSLTHHDAHEHTSLLPVHGTNPTSYLSQHNSTDVFHRLRSFFRAFLTSKYGHYFVIILVALDVACIFAGFLVGLHICERSLGCSRSGQKALFSDHFLPQSKAGSTCEWEDEIRRWKIAQEVLEIASMVFSCAFVVELLSGVVGFGFRYVLMEFLHLRSLERDCFDTNALISIRGLSAHCAELSLLHIQSQNTVF